MNFGKPLAILEVKFLPSLSQIRRKCSHLPAERAMFPSTSPPWGDEREIFENFAINYRVSTVIKEYSSISIPYN